MLTGGVLLLNTADSLIGRKMAKEGR